MQKLLRRFFDCETGMLLALQTRKFSLVGGKNFAENVQFQQNAIIPFVLKVFRRKLSLVKNLFLKENDESTVQGFIVFQVRA